MHCPCTISDGTLLHAKNTMANHGRNLYWKTVENLNASHSTSMHIGVVAKSGYEK